MSDTYQYSERFQLHILACLVKDPVFLRDYRDVIKPAFFDYNHLTSLCRIALDTYDKHGATPTKETMLEAVRDHCIKYRLDDDTRETHLGIAEELYDIDTTDAAIVRDKVVQFGKTQALRGSVMDIIDLLQSDDNYDKAREIIDKALMVGSNTEDLGFSFYDELKHLPGRLKADLYNPAARVPTGLPTLDRAQMGGIARKQHWVVMGFSGYGKSIYLVNMSAAALKRGIPVVYITIGDLHELDVAIRHASRMLRVPPVDIINNTATFQERAGKITKYNPYLRIKYYPSKSVKMSNIRSYLTRLSTVDGINPGLLIIDYPDELAPVNDSMYLNAGSIYGDINRIANDFNCLVWSATQVKIGAPKDKDGVITIQSHGADSSMKAHKVDGSVSFNCTQEEMLAGRARLWVDKVRRGKDKFLVHLAVDRDLMTIREISGEDVNPE